MRAARLVLPLLMSAALLVPAGAQAASGRCSQSGDSCYSAGKRKGKVRLVFSTFSVRGRVETCVTGPRGAARECKRFLLRRGARGIYVVDVAWSAYFTPHGAGRYRVTFRAPGADAAYPGVSFVRKG